MEGNRVDIVVIFTRYGAPNWDVHHKKVVCMVVQRRRTHWRCLGSTYKLTATSR